MNTADRSITLFDTAMRRRFAFIPMMVDYDIIAKDIGHDKFDEDKLNELKSNSENKKLILSLLAVFKLNKKITEDLMNGRERQIGHTYLRKIKDEEQFLNVWKYQIMPLLEEYYASRLGDLEKILDNKVIVKNKEFKDFSEEDLLTWLTSYTKVVESTDK